MFRASKTAAVDFPERKVVLSILDRELPHFARFLLDFKMPADLIGPARYGMIPYHETSLLETAEQSSRTASFHEIVDDWAHDYFAENSDTEWRGSAWQWLKHLHEGNLAVASALRGLTAESVSRQFMALKAKGSNIDSVSARGSRIWIIRRPEDLYKKS